jgi:general stress protein YciG
VRENNYKRKGVELMPNNRDQENREQGGQKSNRGFAAMDEEKQREIASKGGKAAHEKGTAHEFTSEEAREAGRKGGQAAHGGGGRERSED